MIKERNLSRELRLLGLTQKEAAKIIGVENHVISNWATGKTKISPRHVVKLKEIGVPIKALRDPSKEVDA